MPAGAALCGACIGDARLPVLLNVHISSGGENRVSIRLTTMGGHSTEAMFSAFQLGHAQFLGLYLLGLALLDVLAPSSPTRTNEVRPAADGHYYSETEFRAYYADKWLQYWMLAGLRVRILRFCFEQFPSLVLPPDSTLIPPSLYVTIYGSPYPEDVRRHSVLSDTSGEQTDVSG